MPSARRRCRGRGRRRSDSDRRADVRPRRCTAAAAPPRRRSSSSPTSVAPSKRTMRVSPSGAFRLDHSPTPSSRRASTAEPGPQSPPGPDQRAPARRRRVEPGPSAGCSNSSSAAPPPSRVPRRRARMTRVSFSTSTSPERKSAREIRGRSRVLEASCRRAGPAFSAASLGSAGAVAISSGGSS